MTFYDNHGNPVAYTEDDEIVFLFTGEPVAYFYENTVYGFNGKHLGWLEDGWIRDLRGYWVFFTENTNGSGPAKPVKGIKPVKSVKQVKPVKSVRQIKGIKTLNSWAC